jgi:hypothetical protein
LAHRTNRGACLKITIMVEGKTEQAFKPHLLAFLKGRLAGRMPNLDFFPCHGRVYTKDKLRRTVEGLLRNGKAPSDAVIALTDVYTGTHGFVDAADAKQKMRTWVGPNEKSHPHAAQYDFEAWLLPFWTDIQELAGHNKKVPPGPPEDVNHSRPPSYHIREIFRTCTSKRAYSKPRDAARILRGKDLSLPADKCPELKAFLNTIFTLSGAAQSDARKHS